MIRAQSTTATREFSGEFEAVRGSRIRSALVCLDRSALSEACLPFARFVAQAFDAELSLLHVIPIAPDASEPSCADPIAWRVSMREVEHYLEGIRHDLAESRLDPDHVSIELAQGRPAERIVGLAREHHVDLIVLATHGEGGLGPTNLGSTVQQVISLAPCSVLVVPSDTTSHRHVPPKRILVPLDGSTRTESVLPVVADIARQSGATVSLIHVVCEPTASAVLADGDDLALARTLAARMVSEAERYLERVRKQLLPSVLSVEVHVLREVDERRALLDVAERQAIDLIVLAAHGCTCDADRALGTVASYALAHSRSPVLVLQDLPNTRPSDELPPRDSGPPPRERPETTPRPD